MWTKLIVFEKIKTREYAQNEEMEDEKTINEHTFYALEDIRFAIFEGFHSKT